MPYLLAGLATLIPVASAETASPVVVELFASQNCPACPQAHRNMQAVEQDRDDVLILTWSVDYWDYLGEPDPMAMPEAKARQEAYADAMAMRAPYTPQSIYNGVKECPGPRKRDVLRNINLQNEAPEQTRLELTVSDQTASLIGEVGDPVDVMLVRYLPNSEHDSGMVNPVTNIETLGTWRGGLANYSFECSVNCAILAQSSITRKIYSAYTVSN
ncbi:MAG: DUF1223 domain-containing protein [Pseudomonadota bacterium]